MRRTPSSPRATPRPSTDEYSLIGSLPLEAIGDGAEGLLQGALEAVSEEFSRQ